MEGLRTRYDASRVAAARAAYKSVSGRDSSTAGFAGMIEEMSWGLAHLSDRELELVDQRVLTTIFFGSFGLRALRLLRAAAYGPTGRLLASGSPLALRWLVGDIEQRGPRLNVVPMCEFRRAGGEALCERGCRRPAEAFCATHVIPLRLTPHPDSLACTWTWG